MGLYWPKLFLTVANSLLPIAVIVFATGFFPYKPFIPGLAEYEELGYGNPPVAPFDKVVFMVVDALRSDFVFSEESGFKFTQSLIRDGAALPFTAHATSPTITMPRVKAITTGSIPSFLDVILNFAESDTTSSLANQDTWLAQLNAKESGKLVMYGDDTWLKLFPETFSRADGTSSFFVSDFTEVDNNVTRNIPTELERKDWNGMIMHYLGLDHIGHKAGPLSPNMLPKQVEMDDMVRQIYTAIETKPHLRKTLLVLCGDHGMNDGGNHGGSAPGETSPALVFMSPSLKKVYKGKKSPAAPSQEFDYYTKIEQSDVAPTLAALLGFPVPLNNLGVLIPDLLEFWPVGDDRVQLLLRNARQILAIVKATFPSETFDNPFAKIDCKEFSSSGRELACKWLGVTDVFRNSGGLTPPPDVVVPVLLDFCKTAQTIMSSTASNYDVNRLVAGAFLALASSLGAAITLSPKRVVLSAGDLAFLLATVLYGVMMFASSFVEEEQQFWYWITSAIFAFFGIASFKSMSKNFVSTLVLLTFIRIMRRWNQTGQKFVGSPDIVHSDFMRNTLVLWSLVAATYFTLMYQLKQHFCRYLSKESGILGLFLAMALGWTGILFKLSFTARDAPELVAVKKQAMVWLEGLSLVKLARAVFFGVFVSTVWLVAQERIASPETKRKTRQVKPTVLSIGLLDVLTMFLITQTRAQNIPLYLIFRLMFGHLQKLSLSPTQISLATLSLAHTSFFALGNSNAISSVDLANAYNGVSGYSVAVVGLLVFASNWAGPIYWSCAGAVLLASGDTPSDGVYASSGAGTSGRAWVAKEREELRRAAGSGKAAPLVSEAEKAAEGGQDSPFTHHMALTTAFTSFALLSVMAACTVLRTHLFIWTVFSPKYLYAMAWTVAYHLCVNVGMGWLMWRAASKG